jgi:hypothetical protein
VVRDDDYEFEEEVAASGYGDMLFDDERVWDVVLFCMMQHETHDFDSIVTVCRARVFWHAYVRCHSSVACPQNTKYRSAIRRAIQARGANAVDVLDVGTGTGLLALVCHACFYKSLHAYSHILSPGPRHRLVIVIGLVLGLVDLQMFCYC